MSAMFGLVPVQRQITYVREFRENSRSWSRSALTVRLVQLVAGIAVFALPAHRGPWSGAILGLGLLVAVASPARNGQALVLIGAVLGWIDLSHVHTHPTVARVLLFAVALFALHSATTLAAMVPMACQLRRATWQHWLRRCAWTLTISAPLIGCVYGIDAITAGVTSDTLQFIGLIGVLLVILVGTAWFTRRLRRS